MAKLKTILWIHGKESGPHGSKYTALVAAGYDVIAPDLQGIDLEERCRIIEPLILAHRPCIVGSSLGGITAVLAARAAAAASPGLALPGMVLCAPALRYGIAAHIPLADLSVPARVTIVHGLRDDLIPIDVAREYARLHHSKLIEVDDDHRLGNSLDIILTAVQSA